MFCKTFADYLKDTFGENAIETYVSPDNVSDIYTMGYTSDTYVLFKCTKKDYHPDYFMSAHKFSQGQRCPYCSGRKTHPLDSVWQYCIDNNRKDFVDRWDYDLNEELPTECRYTSRKKIWLKCPRGLHESKQFTPRSVCMSKKCKCNKCESIGQYLLDTYGEHGIDLYWGEENEIDPFEISAEVIDRKVYIKCQNADYHPNYQIRPSDFKRGVRCPYCASRKTAKEDSFGTWGINNVDPDFIQKYWSDKNEYNPYEIARCSAKKVWIKCQNNQNHVYNIVADNFHSGSRCPICAHNYIIDETSFGGQYPEALPYWSDKNEMSPYEIAVGYKKKCWFKCEEHGEFLMLPYWFANSYYKCPKCARTNVSSYEDMLMKYMDELGINYLNEFEGELVCINPKTNYRLPYDNELPDYKLIVEVHGSQHYCSARTFGTKTNEEKERDFEYLKWRDEYKKEYAISHGYNYLVIPYWNFRTDYYKEVFDKKIKEITNNMLATTD